MTIRKIDIRKLKDVGGGVNPKVLEHMRKTGALKEYASLEEMRKAREKRGVKEKAPAYLLPDDHFRKRKRRNITLSPQALAIAKKIDQGNVSRGIECALVHYFECPRTDRRRKKK